MEPQKDKKSDKREKELLKVWAVLKRLGLERSPEWLRALYSDAREEYAKLSDQCALFKAKHHKSDPVYALYRYTHERRFLPLSVTAGHEAARVVEVRNCKGETLRHTLSDDDLLAQIRVLCEGDDSAALRNLSECDHAQRLYWLWEKQKDAPHVQSQKSPSTLALVSVQASEKRAYFTLERHSTKLWGPVLALREPSKSVSSNLELLNHTVSRITQLLRARDETLKLAEKKKTKRDSSEKKNKKDKHKKDRKDKKEKKHKHKKHKERSKPVKKRSRREPSASSHSGDSLGSEDSETECSDSQEEREREGYHSSDDETFGCSDESTYDSDREHRRDRRARAKEDSSLSEDVIKDSLSSASVTASSSSSGSQDDGGAEDDDGDDEGTCVIVEQPKQEEIVLVQ